MSFNADNSPEHISHSLLHSANAFAHKGCSHTWSLYQQKPQSCHNPTAVCMFPDLWSEIQGLFLCPFHIKHIKDQIKTIAYGAELRSAFILIPIVISQLRILSKCLPQRLSGSTREVDHRHIFRTRQIQILGRTFYTRSINASFSIQAQ